MKPNSTCLRCGAPVGADSLCPRCEFAVALEPPLPVTQLPTPASELTLKRFGDYELLEELGHGGMGVVYKARHIKLNRLVALKLLLLGQFSSEQAVKRFRREAQAAAALRHPNIVGLHDVGELEGQHYFTMELVEGRSLASLLRDGPLPPRLAAAHSRTMAEAMSAAHTAGIIHRDLKPANILIDLFDQPRITDFGLAKRLDGSGDITLTGHMLGSPNYLAPELAAGREKECGPGTDIFSMGAILYECLTGRPPFLATTLQETLLRIRDTEPIAPRVLNPKLPRDLETICLKCLEKEPAKRYASAQQLAEELNRFLKDEPIHARPIGPTARLWRWCRRKPALASFGATTLVLLLAIAVGSPIAIYRITQARDAALAERRHAQDETTRAEAEALNARQARNAEAAERQLAQTEAARAEDETLNARQLAYASDMNRANQAVQADEFDQALRLLDHHRRTNDLGGASSASPTSPAEKKQVAESGTRGTRPSETDLRGWEWRYLWRQCQGEQRFILGEHTYGATAVGMLADGKTVFSAGNDKFARLWDFETRRPIRTLAHSAAIGGAAASADGRWFATASTKDNKGQPVLLWDLVTQMIGATLTTNFWLRYNSITFSPDSKWLAFATVLRGVRLWDVNSRTEVTNLPAIHPSHEPLGVAFSPDSRTLAYNENEIGTIRLWDIASHTLIGRLTGHESFVSALAFSADGQTLASGSHDRTARLWNLAPGVRPSSGAGTGVGQRAQELSRTRNDKQLAAAEDGRTPLRAEWREGFGFTNQSGGFTALAFSPDGRTLAMSGAGGGGRVIRIVEVETGTEKAALRGHLSDISSLAFMPDGQTLLSASEDGTIRVWDVVPRAKEKFAYVFAPNSISIAWHSYGPALCLSPDGRHLLAVYTNQTFSLWDTLRLAEGERHPLPFTNTTIAALAPGGKLAAFGSRIGEVKLWDAKTSEARFFARPGTNHIHRLVFSLDGRYLAAADNPWTASQMAIANLSSVVRVWKVGAQKETHIFSIDDDAPMSLAFSADAKALIAGFSNGSIKLWQLDRPGGEAATFLKHDWQVEGGLALLPDGQTLISAAGPDIRFWDVRSRRQTSKLNARAGLFSSVALSGDGRRLAAGASDGRITIWDVASQQEVATLEGHKYEVMQLAFTPDGDHLISASKDQLRVWLAASPAETDAAREKQARK